MRRQLRIIIPCVLLLIFCCAGCEQLMMKQDKVTVNIMLAVSMNVLDADNRPVEASVVDGVKVTTEIQRNGKDRLVFDRVVQNGACQATASFEISQGQFITCTATLQSGYGDYQPVTPGTVTLTWETVNASKNYGGIYNWYPTITLQMKSE
ncbi:MAG: hypothetical protein JW840_07395 [Candidatus Thermoplasmatota archaeon]|nr:hypothetical protein [Candidatus Thermoplasmatota archaeon]